MSEPTLRIVTIRNVDMYKDGGTIGIKCFGYVNPRNIQEFELCFDRRIGSPTKGSLWIGYPGKQDSVEILDKETIAYVVEQLKKFRDNQNNMIDTVVSSYAVPKNENGNEVLNKDLVSRSIFLIEKIWFDSMENEVSSAVGYSSFGFVNTEDEAKQICENGRIYTRKDCWAVMGEQKEYKYSEVKYCC